MSKARNHLKVKTGIVLVGGDMHVHPADGMSTATRGFIKFIKRLEPEAIILNGDVLDFPQISRHPPIGHQIMPTVMEEIYEGQEQLCQIERVSKGIPKLWPLGNHDARFETKLASNAPEFRELPGHSLAHYFPKWLPCWSVWINETVIIKHRGKGGDHAAHNNVKMTGTHTITNHLHQGKVTGVTNAVSRVLWGVDTGMMADVYATPFTDYLEDGARNWRSSFCVLTFKDYQLLQPELVLVWDHNHVEFRGEIIKV